MPQRVATRFDSCMHAIPIFTRAELAHAFGLLMNESAATRWADEWFIRLADDEGVDENGFYLYVDWTAGDPNLQASIVAYAGTRNPSSRTGYEHLRLLTEDELGEFLMYFSDFHLNLLSFSSPIVCDR